jgi:exo-beta-1,3-glucanase (GH17 family)
MNYTELLNIPTGNAICYSGFREGQQPGGIYPTYDEIKDIKKEKLDLKVMLGAYIVAEANNFGCPWGGSYSEEDLMQNKSKNVLQIKKLIKLANEFPDIVFSLSAGNEACVDWTDHYVPVDRVIKYVRMIKKGAKQPVTFCENYSPWLSKMKALVNEVDFISIHTYPVWEYKNIHEALEYTKQNYYAVADTYPEKLVVITEAGWATNSNGKGIHEHNVSEEFQKIYFEDLMQWNKQDGILTFVFEAFDETWKGSSEIFEPEKHWGLFNMDRTPKLVMEPLFAI